MSAKRRVEIGLALFAVYVIWGSTYLAMRVAVVGHPPFLMGAVRYVAAGAILYAICRAHGAPAPTWAEWGASTKVGSLLMVGGNGLIAVPFAADWIGSGLAAVVTATMPLWTAACGFLFGARPSRGEWAGLAVGFAGVALLNQGGELRARNTGALVILFAPVCWALGTAWSRRLALPRGAMSSAAQMIGGGLAMALVGAARRETFTHMPSPSALVALAVLIVFGSVIAFSAFGYLVSHTRPSVATSYAYVNPVVALAIGATLGGEKVHAATWGAAGVILAGVVVISLAQRRRSMSTA